MSAREPTYYEILEVAPTATREEIQVAYNKSRATFAANSLAVYSLFTAEECREMQERIEEAYRTLMNEEARARYDESIGIAPSRPQGRPVSTLQRPQAAPVRAGAGPAASSEGPAPARPEAGRMPGVARAGAAAAERPTLPEGAVVTGALLRKIREQQGISLRDIAQTTKVNLTYLQFIEEENFRQLPVPAYLRGFLKAYAKCIGLDPDRVSSEYLKLYALYHEIKSER
ncbi:MAG TPA: helix-turn-helix domain-containing protein [Thermodesulfobacteriota bacterium]